MSMTRRRLLTSAAIASAAPSLVRGPDDPPKRVTVADLERILKEPVLKLDGIKKPVKVASIELLRNGKAFLVRTRSSDGAEAITVPNPDKMAQVYPFFLKDVAPVFVGQDARDLEKL